MAGHDAARPSTRAILAVRVLSLLAAIAAGLGFVLSMGGNTEWGFPILAACAALVVVVVVLIIRLKPQMSEQSYVIGDIISSFFWPS